MFTKVAVFFVVATVITALPHKRGVDDFKAAVDQVKSGVESGGTDFVLAAAAPGAASASDGSQFLSNGGNNAASAAGGTGSALGAIANAPIQAGTGLAGASQ